MDPESESKKIFVVDDDPSVTDYLKTILESWNFRTVFSDHGSGVIEKVVQEQPDLVLLDIMLPDVDGITLCRRIRSNGKTSHIPVIMLTSLSDSSTVYESLVQGAIAFVSKPFEADALKDKIDKAFQKTS